MTWPDSQRPGQTRQRWLEERRRIAVERYDSFAATYDEGWGIISPTHAAILGRFLARCAPGGLILDAACGTGKYWQSIRASGRRVTGLDQSAGMLAAAAARYPDVAVECRSLVDLDVVAAYDGAVCVDAMELVCPEDWPIVVAGLGRALRPGCPLYLTVEQAAVEGVEAAYRAAAHDGLPVVPGEWLENGGYHYYPSRDQVLAWLAGAGFVVEEETIGDEYLHLIARRSSPPTDRPGGGQR